MEVFQGVLVLRLAHQFIHFSHLAERRPGAHFLLLLLGRFDGDALRGLARALAFHNLGPVVEARLRRLVLLVFFVVLGLVGLLGRLGGLLGRGLLRRRLSDGLLRRGLLGRLLRLGGLRLLGALRRYGGFRLRGGRRGRLRGLDNVHRLRIYVLHW